MTSTQVLAGAASFLVVAGVWLGLGAAFGPLGRPGAGTGRPPWLPPRLRLSWLAALSAGLSAWWLTGWPALGVGVAIGAVGLPAMFRAGTRDEQQIARVEGVEEWCRRLADVLAIGVGLEQAIQTAARTAPAAVAPEVTTLSARLSARWPTERALRGFADDMADPTADLVVAALILAARRRGPGVASALTAIADSVSEDVAARRKVEADRAKPRTTARVVTAITMLVIVAGALNRGYTEPYATVLGQVVLTATLCFFAAALWSMHAMTTGGRPDRILEPLRGQP